jgi:hypothetical protein
VAQNVIDVTSINHLHNVDVCSASAIAAGAPNVLKFAPAPRSIIRACDFDSLQELAEYLLYLDRNETAYQEYLQWKTESGPTQEFQSLMATSDTNPFCRMCIAAAETKQWAFDEVHQERLKQFEELRAAFHELNAQLDEDRAVTCKGKDKWWHIELPDNQTVYTMHDTVLPAPADEITVAIRAPAPAADDEITVAIREPATAAAADLQWT